MTKREHDCPQSMADCSAMYPKRPRAIALRGKWAQVGWSHRPYDQRWHFSLTCVHASTMCTVRVDVSFTVMAASGEHPRSPVSFASTMNYDELHEPSGNDGDRLAGCRPPDV